MLNIENKYKAQQILLIVLNGIEIKEEVSAFIICFIF